MSNDLISRERVTDEISLILADVLISAFHNKSISFDELNRKIQECLKSQPIAYDVDKACRKISENRDMDNLIDVDHAIKIIKAEMRE